MWRMYNRHNLSVKGVFASSRYRDCAYTWRMNVRRKVAVIRYGNGQAVGREGPKLNRAGT